jgi:hypothetical protein
MWPVDPFPAVLPGHLPAWSWPLVALVGVAVAHRRLGPSSWATTSTVERALPSSAVQLRCWSRPTTTTRLGHATASITLDTYGHLFPDELEALAGRLEDARADALATLARTQRGPTILPLRERAGQ